MSLDGNHGSSIPFQDGHIVQCTVEALEGLTIGSHLYQGTRLYGEVVMIECIQTSPDILRTYISQKTQTPHVHTQDRNLLLPHPAGSLEERTVATHRDHEIGIEVITLEHLGSVQVVKMMVAQESIIVFIHIQLGTEDREHGQHLLNRCRLLHLIAIAKDGKFQFTMLHHYVFWVQR